MRDATGAVQSAVVLGGTSDLAVAVVDRLADDRLRRVMLAARDADAALDRARRLQADHERLDVQTVDYDALDDDAHRRVLEHSGAGGDIDLVIVAFGSLGDPFEIGAPVDSTSALAAVNFGAAVAACQTAADVLLAQGHGSLVVFSSVAGTRVRPDNAVYGASKAGLDGFALALADELHDTGVHVMVVRPGFVHTKMTAGRPEAPFATTADKVAADVVAGLRRRRRVVWSPPTLRLIFAGLRVLPAPLWRKLSGARDGRAG